MRKGMGFSWSSQAVVSDAVSSGSSSSSLNAKKPTSAKKKYGTSNAMLQMDDFLALAREPVPQKATEPKNIEVKQPVKEPVTDEILSKEEPPKTDSVSSNQDEKPLPEPGESIEFAEKQKRKRDRNAPMAPRPPRENPKKNRKKKNNEEKAEKKETENLSEAVEELKIEPEPEPEPAPKPEPEPEPVKKEPRLNELVQEYLKLAPTNDKYRARNSELMNIVHDLVGLDRSVFDYKSGTGKEDKRFLKLEEMLTRCLLRFDNIERTNEVLTKTRKDLIQFTQSLLNKLEAKATDTSTSVQEENIGKKSEKKEISKKEEKKVNETKEEEAVKVDDIELETNENASLSIEEILKKKGKIKKSKNHKQRKHD